MLQWILTAVGLAPPPPPSGALLTRESAQELVRWYSRSQGAVLSPGLNAQGFGGITVGSAQVYFEYHEDRKALADCVERLARLLEAQ